MGMIHDLTNKAISQIQSAALDESRIEEDLKGVANKGTVQDSRRYHTTSFLAMGGNPTLTSMH